jgi:hypothetical protein
MRSLFILPLLLMPLAVAQNQTLIVSQEKPDLSVVKYKWSKTRRVTGKATANDPPLPAPSIAASASRTAQRSDRVNDSGGPRDPTPHSIEARSAALEKIVRESRTPQPKTLDGFTYLLKLKNDSANKIEVVFWEYQFIDAANAANVARRQFLCGLNLKPGKEKELTAFSLSGPSKVVSAESLSDKTPKPPLEKVLINRIEYADGTIWQRKDWSFGEIRLSYKNAMATAWTEMCRTL